MKKRTIWMLGDVRYTDGELTTSEIIPMLRGQISRHIMAALRDDHRLFELFLEFFTHEEPGDLGVPFVQNLSLALNDEAHVDIDEYLTLRDAAAVASGRGRS